MSYVEITARLKLLEIGNRCPEDDSHLCNALREEIEALLDRFHKSSRLGAPSSFDSNQPLFVKVDVVE